MKIRNLWPELLILIGLFALWEAGLVLVSVFLLAFGGLAEFEDVLNLQKVLLIVGSVCVVAAIPYLVQVCGQARRKRNPALGKAYQWFGVLLAVVLLISTGVSAWYGERLSFLFKPSIFIVSEEEVEEVFRDERVSDELYLQVCQAFVDMKYIHGEPVIQCKKRKMPEARHDLRPSETARVLRTADLKFQVLYRWGAGVVILLIVSFLGAIVFGVRMARRA